MTETTHFIETIIKNITPNNLVWVLSTIIILYILKKYGDRLIGLLEKNTHDTEKTYNIVNDDKLINSMEETKKIPDIEKKIDRMEKIVEDNNKLLNEIVINLIKK